MPHQDIKKIFIQKTGRIAGKATFLVSNVDQQFAGVFRRTRIFTRFMKANACALGVVVFYDPQCCSMKSITTLSEDRIGPRVQNGLQESLKREMSEEFSNWFESLITSIELQAWYSVRSFSIPPVRLQVYAHLQRDVIASQRLQKRLEMDGSVMGLVAPSLLPSRVIHYSELDKPLSSPLIVLRFPPGKNSTLTGKANFSLRRGNGVKTSGFLECSELAGASHYVRNLEFRQFMKMLQYCIRNGLFRLYDLVTLLPAFSVLGLQLIVSPQGDAVAVRQGTGIQLRGVGNSTNGFFLQLISVIRATTTEFVQPKMSRLT